MRFTSYFIKHPVISVILNAMIVVLGVLCFKELSIREYPNVSFPVITVSAEYPNASPDLVETSVTNILEDLLAGIEGLETITSKSTMGSSTSTLVFRSGTSMDKALSATQEAVNGAKAFLPAEVKPPFVAREKKNSGLPFMAISLESKTRNDGDLTHYANLTIKNRFRSISGVSSVDVWGQPYTYSVRLASDKLFSFGINVDEVVDALAKSHVALPVGKYQDKIPTTLNSSLRTKEEFDNLVIRPGATPLVLNSIADVSLETDKTTVRVHVNGHAGLIVSINRANDANPLDVSKAVHHVVDELKKNLPNDVHIQVILDQSTFINSSLKSIRSSFSEAIFLVLVIVFLFLRTTQATLIPLITIPISLSGSLLFLKIVGFSINTMTLLAMVLAIGLVVDDSIVVLENIWRHIEEGERPLEAAIKGSKELGFAIIAMTCTLASVYIPLAFIQGILGQLFIEFAVALAGSVVVSGFVALTLSPLMCCFLLKKETKKWCPTIDLILSRLVRRYDIALTYSFNHIKMILFIALSSVAVSMALYFFITHETAPKEDRGLIGIFIPPVRGEDSVVLDEHIARIQHGIGRVPESTNQLTFIGEWGANMLIPLKEHRERKRSASDLVAAIQPLLLQYPSIDPLVWSWDNGLPGIDNTGNGSELTLVISTSDSYRDLFERTEHLKETIDTNKQFGPSFFDLTLDTLGYSIEIDNNQMAKLGSTPHQIAKTIEVFFSGDKRLAFEKDGVVYSITVKGSPVPWTLDELYITTASGKRISLGAITKMKPKSQPASLEHYQQMRSTTLHVPLLKGQSIARGIDTLWDLAHQELPSSYQLTWTGEAKAFNESSNSMFLLLCLSLVFIYAIFAMQFEHFIDPLIILCTVPLASLGALLSIYLMGQTLNIFTEVGLITLIGLITKHGILIVEFANQLRQKGIEVNKAIHTAALARLRPILMTTGAMVFGAIPLVCSHEAGSEARRAIGTVLIGGLSWGTLFTLFVVPVVYLLIKQKH